MKKVLRALGGVLLLAVLAVFVMPLHRRSALPAPAEFAGRSAFSLSVKGKPLQVGASKVSIVAPEGAPLAGYAGFRKWDGGGPPLHVRALSFKAGELTALIVSIETLLIPADLEAEILRRAKLPPQTCALITATHTHSGIGGLWDNALAAALGAGRFDRRAFDAVADAAALAISRAIAWAAPAKVEWAQGRYDVAARRSGSLIDQRATALQITTGANGQLARLIVYGMHPTIAARSERHFDGDWPAATSDQLETGLVFSPVKVALVLQGAVGNATWPRWKAEQMSRIPIAVADAAIKLPRNGLDVSSGELSCNTLIVPLAPPQSSAAIAWPFRRAAENAIALIDPRFAVQTEISIGGLKLLGVPGEPTGALQAEDGAVIVGLADGYVGYVETPEAIKNGTGEAARSWYGPGLAEKFRLRPR